MRPNQMKLLSLGLLLAATLPLATDAAAPVPPASKAAACLTVDAPPPPDDRGGLGDEKFFNIPGGVPNVMVLLDTSGSMMDLPNDIPYPSTFPASGGTCSTALYAPTTTKRTATPFDNGFSTGLTVDAPPWALPQCGLVARPAGDNVADNCLFRGDSHYKANGNRIIGSLTQAKVFNANPCGAVQSNGNPIMNQAGTQVMPTTPAECTTCLADAGYYLYRVTYRDTGGTNRTTTQAVFRGDFLNVNPPKYISARKVVKDLARLDASNTRPTDQVRLGLTIFTASGNASGVSTGLRAEDGGRLMVPLGPNCDDAVPPTLASFAPARQAIINAVNNTGVVNFAAATPLSETLFNIGQYFAAPTRYTTLFGAPWVRAAFNETGPGLIAAPWATAAGKRQGSFCWSCQQSSVVVVTDGEPNNDSNLPANPTPASNHATFNNDFRRWSNPTVDCPACGNDLSGSPANALHKVAYFLSQTDLRPELPDTPRPQTVSTYTISFGIDATLDPKAIAVLSQTAKLGNGQFKNTSTGEELGNALNEAVNDVLQRTTSFSSANANSLQTSRTDAADTYVGRFKPTDAPVWEGHLFATQLFDEFARGCDDRFSTANQPAISCGSRTNPNMNGNETADGKAACTDAFLIDKDCDPLIEDAGGTYKKGAFDPTTHQLVSTPDDANMFWDAGRVLSDPTQVGYRSATEGQQDSRQVWTTVDTNGDGLLTAADGVIEFVASNAAALAPSMSLDKATCTSIMQGALLCGAAPMPACPAGATLTAAERTTCAAAIINYLRGWDVLDADGDHCAGPGAYDNTNPWGTCTTSAACGGGATCVAGKCVNTSCASGEQRDRVNDSRPPAAQQFWKLGDIFHSSPALVRPPIDKFLCATGLFTQCVQTIFSSPSNEGTQTPLDPLGPGLDAYDLWRRANLARKQFVLVGANDGMLHAFDAGDPDTSLPAYPDGSRPYTAGTGSELWGYIPPDLLPRLKDALRTHGYYVDGTTMVRDVWVDFNKDGLKQQGEFRTVAVISERGGGIRRTGLDVSDPSRPVFLWTFPQGCSADTLLAGQSWGEFLPRPPPIGPVRIKNRAGDPDPGSRGWQERWVVVLNGGHDPALVRGRAVWMLDVWTGQKLWQYTDADFKAMRGDDKASMFPVAATIGLSDVGRLDTLVGPSQTDHFFDTATWGDLGGNVFVARMYEPGEINPATGLVTNWTAARAFEQARRADDTQGVAGRSPFFFMTQNVPKHPRGLRVLLGSGNRSELMASRPACGPHDMLGCAQAGCGTVSATSTKNFGAGSCNASLGTFQATGGTLTFTPGAAAGCTGDFAAPGPLEASTTVSASCGAGGSLVATTARTTCDSAGAPLAPSTSQEFSPSLNFNPALADPCVPSRMFSFWAYGLVAEKRMAEPLTAAAARAFDDDRFTDVPLASCDGWPGRQCSLVEVANADVRLDVKGNFTPTCLDGATKCKADAADPGWMYSYGRFCPEGPGKCGTAPTWCDERTANQGFSFSSCMIWSSFRPTGTAASSDPCTSAAGSPSTFLYFADFLTGIPTLSTDTGVTCGVVDDPLNPSRLTRAVKRSAYAAPQTPAMSVAISPTGQTQISAKQSDSSGNFSHPLGTRSSLAEPLYWLEVPRQVHTCRHVDPTTCK